MVEVGMVEVDATVLPSQVSKSRPGVPMVEVDGTMVLSQVSESRPGAPDGIAELAGRWGIMIKRE
jgi:hypothetical protein